MKSFHNFLASTLFISRTEKWNKGGNTNDLSSTVMSFVGDRHLTTETRAKKISRDVSDSFLLTLDFFLSEKLLVLSKLCGLLIFLDYSILKSDFLLSCICVHSPLTRSVQVHNDCVQWSYRAAVVDCSYRQRTTRNVYKEAVSLSLSDD